MADDPKSGDTPHEPSGDERLPASSSADHGAGLPLADLLACLPATIWTTDRAMAVTFVQGHLIRSLQVDPSRLLGHTLPDLLMDGREDHPLIQGHLTALDGHETTVRIEWGGNIYNARIAPLHDSRGEVIGCIGVHQQIGWLPDDEGTLRESDVRLRRIIDSNMIGIVFGNDEGQITEANDAFLQLAGYSREDLETDGISWPALSPIEFHQRQFGALEEMRRTGRCTPFETELIRKDGMRVTVMVGGARLSARRREGVAFVLDVSDRNRLKQRLRAELACADALLAAADVPTGLRETTRVVAAEFGWQAVAVWQAEPANGPGRITARHASMPIADEELDAMARRTWTTGETMWSAPARTLLVPVSGSGQKPAVLLASCGRTDVPGAGAIDAMQAIAARVGIFLTRWNSNIEDSGISD